MQNDIRKIYKQIQDSINKLIPEKWTKVYLYASVINGRGGEMYFYYIPKKLIKPKPINCYEIPDKFSIEEELYSNKLKQLYEVIKLLNHCTKLRWTNITITMDKEEFTLEYHFNDLVHSKYTDEQRRMYWCYKNLNMPLEALNSEDRNVILNYKEETNMRPVIYKEDMTDPDIRNQILRN